MPRQASGQAVAPARTRSSRLSQRKIVDVALTLIDEQGLAALTMRSLASRLGVEAMSLYKYVANRDKLFDAVVDRIVGELADYEEVSAEPVQGWRSYLAGIAHGVRRYARAHPHAFPLVATRPSEAPWINPPLRSVDWIEAFLSGLQAEGFTDEQVLFAYRSFNSFLLGFLLLETSSMAIHEPLPGDGSFPALDSGGAGDPASATLPAPGTLTPTRSPAERQAIADATEPKELLDPQGQLDPERYPSLHRLAEGLAEDHFEAEFGLGLNGMLDQIATFIGREGTVQP